MTSRDVSCLVSPTGPTAEGPHGPAVLSGRQQAAEAAHCRAREQKQVRDGRPTDALHIWSLLGPLFHPPLQETHLGKEGFLFFTLHNVTSRNSLIYLMHYEAFYLLIVSYIRRPPHYSYQFVQKLCYNWLRRWKYLFAASFVPPKQRFNSTPFE